MVDEWLRESVCRRCRLQDGLAGAQFGGSREIKIGEVGPESLLAQGQTGFFRSFLRGLLRVLVRARQQHDADAANDDENRCDFPK